MDLSSSEPYPINLGLAKEFYKYLWECKEVKKNTRQMVTKEGSVSFGGDNTSMSKHLSSSESYESSLPLLSLPPSLLHTHTD